MFRYEYSVEDPREHKDVVRNKRLRELELDRTRERKLAALEAEDDFVKRYLDQPEPKRAKTSSDDGESASSSSSDRDSGHRSGAKAGDSASSSSNGASSRSGATSLSALGDYDEE